MYEEENSFIASNYCVRIPIFLKRVQNVYHRVFFDHKRIYLHIAIRHENLQQAHHTRLSRADFCLHFVEKGSALNPLSSLLKQCIVSLSVFNAAKLKGKLSHLVIYSSIIILLELNSRPVKWLNFEEDEKTTTTVNPEENLHYNESIVKTNFEVRTK